MQSPFEQIHLVDYLQVIWKRKWLLLICFATTVMTVVVKDNNTQPIYRTTATIMIDSDSSRSIIAGQSQGVNIASLGLFLNTHYEMMLSQPVFVKVVKALRLDQVGQAEEKEQREKKSIFPDFSSFFNFLKPTIEDKPLQQDPNDKLIQQVNALRKKITITPVEDTKLFKIDVEDTDPRLAMEIANTFAETYIQHDFESDMEATKKKFALFNEQLLEIRKEISGAQSSIYAFKEKEKIFSLEGRQRLQSAKIDAISAQQFRAKTDKMVIESKLKELEKIQKEGDYKGSIRAISESAILQGLYRDLIQSEIQLSQLQEGSSDVKHPILEYPEVAAIKAKIELLKKELNKELQRAIESLKVEYAILENQEKTITSTLQKLEAEFLQENKLESRYAPLEQEAKVSKELYDLLLVKLKELNITEGTMQTTIRIIEPALLPKNPVKPNKKFNLILGIAAGLVLGVGSAFFREYLDRTIRKPTEVEQYLGLSVLCAVPKVSVKGWQRRH